MATKEEQQKALNAKRRLRNKQIAQLRASNEMLEATKENIIKRYGENSETTENLLHDIDIAKEQNLERAQSYLGASKNEVESIMYNKVNPQEEKAYFDRLERQGKNDEDLHKKDISNDKTTYARVKETTKPKSKLAELTEKLKKLNKKSEPEEEIDIMDIEIPPEEIIAPNAGDVTLVPLENTFDEEFNGLAKSDTLNEKYKIKPVVIDEKKDKNIQKEDVVEEKKEIVKEEVTKPKKMVNTNIQTVEQKSCEDFDPRDIPSYVQYDIIPLPSKGQCYAHKKGNIPVAYLTAADENLITARNMYENGSMIDIILERKILDKSIKVKDLCKGDRDAIAIWLRATAYGPEYPIVATYEDKEIKSVIDLSNIKYLDFDLKGDENGWFEYKTSTGDILKFKILTSGEEVDLVKNNIIAEDIVNRNAVVQNIENSIEYVDNIDGTGKEEVIEALNLVKNWCLDIDGVDFELKDKAYSTFITDRMFAQTMSVNGNTDREYIKAYIENMRANDALEYRKYVNSNIPGVNLNITVPIPESMGGGSFDTFLSIGETIFINV